MGERAQHARMGIDEFLERVTKLRDNMRAQQQDAPLDAEFFWSAIWLMLNAMLVSFHKYGAMSEGYPERVCAIGTPATIPGAAFDDLGSFGKRLRWYFFGEKNLDYDEPGEPEYNILPGNVEYLVDAMNFVGIEFAHPAHPNAHYAATDKDGSPGRVAHNPLYENKGVQYRNKDLLGANETTFIESIS